MAVHKTCLCTEQYIDLTLSKTHSLSSKQELELVNSFLTFTRNPIASSHTVLVSHSTTWILTYFHSKYLRFLPFLVKDSWFDFFNCFPNSKILREEVILKLEYNDHLRKLEDRWKNIVTPKAEHFDRTITRRKISVIKKSHTEKEIVTFWVKLRTSSSFIKFFGNLLWNVRLFSFLNLVQFWFWSLLL